MKASKDFATAIAELKEAESTPSPDAALIAMCERFTLLSTHRPWRKEEAARKMREINEAIALQRKIPSLRPVTAAGRRAKAQAALASLERLAGTQNRMADAALRDYINNDAVSRPFMSGQLPENDAMMWDQAERTMMRMYRLMSDHQKHELQRHVAWEFEKSERGASAAVSDAELQ